MASTTLFDGNRYRVRLNAVSDDPLVVVSFRSLSPRPCRASPFFLEEALSRAGINAIGIIPDENDWFLYPEMIDVVDAILQNARGKTLVGLGSSMGGFAALNYSSDLKLSSAIVFAPQFSIDPIKVPFEQRWRSEALNNKFAQTDKIDRIAALGNGFLIHDPWVAADHEHCKLILSYHSLTEFPIWLGGHFLSAMLHEIGLLESLIINFIRGQCNTNGCRIALRKNRRDSQTFWDDFGKCSFESRQDERVQLMQRCGGRLQVCQCAFGRLSKPSICYGSRVLRMRP